MRHDATDRKRMIQKSDLVADFKMLGLCDDVISNGLISGFKGTARAK